MPRKDELEQYEHTEARDLVQLFEAVRPSPQMQAPPDFRVKVLTQIEQRRARRGFLAGVTSVLTPTWAPVLAASLLLSMSFNAWMGFRAWTQLGPGDRRVQGIVLGSIDSDPPFNADLFQAGITSQTDLGRLATAHSVIGKQAMTFGFAAKSAQARFFILGALYAEALAYLRSGDLETAGQRVAALEKELGNVQVPRSLEQYLSKMHSLLQSQRYAAEVLGEFLSLFEPLYVDYAREQGADRLALFRAGAWLVNMNLAAAAGDKASLRQVKAVQYLNREMQRLNAPRGVLNALGQIKHIVTKPEMTDRDMKEVHKLVKKMQMLLG